MALNIALFQRGVEGFLVISFDRNRDKLRPDGSFGSYTDSDLTLSHLSKTGCHFFF